MSCDWNPTDGRPALASEDSHAQATLVVGGTAWHLCADCAALPRFKSHKKRPLRKGEGRTWIQKS